MPRYVFVILAAALIALAVAGGSHASTQRFDDHVEDVLDAPDIGAVNLVTNDNEAITVGMQIHDRTAFGGTDAYSIALDIDSNAATGGGADYRVAGADYVIDLSDVASRLMIWNGTSYVLVTPRPLLPTVWVEGYGPVVQIPRTALADPQSFDVVLRTASGIDVDLAPDVGSWAYTVRPLELAPGGVTVGRARAGKLLLAGMQVIRSDFASPLHEGAIACGARVGGTRLDGRGQFVGQLVVCAWRLPNGARGQRVRGRVAVAFQGETAVRSFNVRVLARD
jgi:hypothetical protein